MSIPDESTAADELHAADPREHAREPGRSFERNGPLRLDRNRPTNGPSRVLSSFDDSVRSYGELEAAFDPGPGLVVSHGSDGVSGDLETEGGRR